MIRAFAILLLSALPAFAQQSDRDYLTAFLEDNLSGAGRTVTITGFAGALSSQATADSITIADAKGVWLTLNGLTLDWSRSSLLSGQVVVNELSAKEIIVARAPETDPNGFPASEATGFVLPDLPVSVEIGRVAAERIVLEPAVLGQAVEGNLDASISLVAGLGKASFALQRSDTGPQGKITLDASYSKASALLEITLQAIEGQGGLAATLLGLPGTPAVELSVIGSGPITAFEADIKLATDAEDRLTGRVSLKDDSSGGVRFGADLAGNIAPLFVPDYAAFFGADVKLKLAGDRSSTGRIAIDDLEVSTRTLKLSGNALIATDGLPEVVQLSGKLASPDGQSVLLPFSGAPTRVNLALIALKFDEAEGAGWSGSFDLQGLDRPDFSASRFVVQGSGRIARTPAGNLFDAMLTYDATGLRPTNAAVAAALGPAISGSVTARWEEATGLLTLPDLQLTGDGFEGTATLTVEGLQTALMTTGRIEVSAEDFSRFSALAGRPLAGNGTAVINGSAGLLSGVFDLEASLDGQGVSFGIPQVDRLLDRQSSIKASVFRNATGTTLRSMLMVAKSVSAAVEGKLSSEGSTLSGKVNVGTLGDLGPGYGGSLSVDATFDGTPDLGRIRITGTGLGLATGQAELDQLLAGLSKLEIAAKVQEGQLLLETAQVNTPQLDATATGRVSGGVPQIALLARLANLGLFVPEFPGPLTVKGTVDDATTSYKLALKATGPGQVDARVSGTVDRSFRSADLSILGSSQASLANAFIGPRSLSGPVRFDLRLNGPVRLASLSGRVSLAGGRLTDPETGLAFERLEAVLDLSAGKARVAATMQALTGGKIRVDGMVALAAPYDGDLTITLDGLRLVDPELYKTSARGTLQINGPLTGGAMIQGRIALADTEIRIPSTGIGGAGGLPGLQHKNESAEVRSTRAKAGLLGLGGARSRSGLATPFKLDVEIWAPNRVFVRGRGIDAELGGALMLSGSTSAIVPSGGLSLIRGRLDILGKRLVLSSADLRLEGDFVPNILISASTQSDGITSFVMINGPADAPDVSFTSVPDLPQEEVLSRLLFGRGLDTISALQAAQLANAVAVLAGRGGEGVIGRLRKNFGLDDLDVATADDGTTALRAGKYIAENIYTEIELDQQGKTRINLNLDLRPGVTVKGKLGADGETGIGVFVEKDY